jgi:hypothetical protein
MKADDKYTRSVECVVFIIIGGRIPTIDDMTTDEHGLQQMSNIDPVDLRMSSRQWELQGLGLTPSGKALINVWNCSFRRGKCRDYVSDVHEPSSGFENVI